MTMNNFPNVGNTTSVYLVVSQPTGPFDQPPFDQPPWQTPNDHGSLFSLSGKYASVVSGFPMNGHPEGPVDHQPPFDRSNLGSDHG